MVTASAIVVLAADQDVRGIVEEWPYASAPKETLRLELPALSTVGHLTMGSDTGEDPFETFRRFNRVYHTSPAWIFRTS